MKKPRFNPPPPIPPEPPPPQLQLYDKPEDQILLHGEMIRDAAVITEILQGLPFAGNDYRGNLRVIISANMRMRDTCLLLLGEMLPLPESEPEPSNIIDQPDEEQIAEYVASRRPPARKNGKPKKTGPAPDDPNPSGRKAEILAILRKTALSSGDLIGRLKSSGMTAPAVYSALHIMRNEGLIDSRVDPLDGERKNFIK